MLCRLSFNSHFRSEEEIPDQIDAAILELNEFCETEYNNIVESLNFIARRMIDTFGLSTPQARADRKLLRHELDGICEDVVNLEKFVGLNCIHLLKTIAEYDS
jgi:SPX domain protein involved in polyphosphate accumulation